MRHVNVECELQTSIYRIFAGYVCVCECVRNMAYELPRWMLLAPDQSCFHVLLAVSSRRAQQHKSTYFIGIYVLLWRRPAL